METKLRYYEIAEARRNPEKNPKIGVLDDLKQYANDPNIFISFVEINKIGVNPQSIYNTPNGLYTYPLKKLFNKTKNTKTNRLDVPFQSKTPGVYVLRVKNPENILDLEKYTEADWKKDELKLINIFVEQFIKKNQINNPSAAYEYAKGLINTAEADAKNTTPGGILWNATRWLFFWLKGRIGFSVLPGNDEYIENLITGQSKPIDYNNKKVAVAAKIAKVERGNTILWSNIFKKLGYEGVYDSGGQGIIHPSEKTQAVFWEKSSLEVVDYSTNKPHPPQETKTKSQWIWPVDDDYIKNILDFFMGLSEIETYVSSTSRTFSGKTIAKTLDLYSDNAFDPGSKSYLTLKNTPAISKMATDYRPSLKQYDIAKDMPEKLFFQVSDDPKAGVSIDAEYLTITVPKGKIFATGDTTTRFRVNYLYNPRMQSEIEFYLTNVIDQD